VARVDAAPGGQAPAGARAGELIALGSLIISLVQSADLLTSVVNTVQAWLSRRGARSVRLELNGDVLEVSGLSSREQRELIQAWVNRHAPPGEGP
jgi:hypothetical protein